jgi:hypothetical protein
MRNVMKKLSSKMLICILFILPSYAQALETTVYGKIVGIETRHWGFHVQTDFSAGESIGCKVNPGASYMFDLDISQQGANANGVISTLLAAFASGKEVSFLLYECRPGNTRPMIGHLRVK